MFGPWSSNRSGPCVRRSRPALTWGLRAVTIHKGGFGRMAVRRRDFLQMAGVTATAGFASGCAVRNDKVSATPSAARAGSLAAASPTHVSLNLVAPRISWERVIRTTVGLRPHRDSGFVLKAEKFGPHDSAHRQRAAHLGVGCPIPPRRRDFLSPTSATGRSARLGSVLDRQLQRHRRAE